MLGYNPYSPVLQFFNLFQVESNDESFIEEHLEQIPALISGMRFEVLITIPLIVIS